MQRSAITLVETMVVVSILAIFAGLVLMGVQRARDTSRRIACQNNLHQIGLAVEQFVQSSRTYPTLFANRGSKGDVAFERTLWVTLLPEMSIVTLPTERRISLEDPKNLPPSVLRCPAGNQLLGYRFSYGSGVRSIENQDGITRAFRGVAPSDVTDGLSNTALVSERMSGDQFKKPVGIAALPFYFTDERFIADCSALKIPERFVPETGLNWQGIQPLDLVYSHAATPNSPQWDCQGGPRQLVTARSYHAASVSVLFADGHMNSCSSSIDPVVWKAMGTIRGFEVPVGNSP